MDSIFQSFQLSSSFTKNIANDFPYRIVGVLISRIDKYHAGVELVYGLYSFMSYSNYLMKVS